MITSIPNLVLEHPFVERRQLIDVLRALEGLLVLRLYSRPDFWLALPISESVWLATCGTALANLTTFSLAGQPLETAAAILPSMSSLQNLYLHNSVGHLPDQVVQDSYQQSLGPAYAAFTTAFTTGLKYLCISDDMPAQRLTVSVPQKRVLQRIFNSAPVNRDNCVTAEVVLQGYTLFFQQEVFDALMLEKDW